MAKLKTHKALNKNVGYVYIVANKYIPFLVKIGKTDDPDRRLEELSRHEGVPGRYRKIFQEKVFNYHIAENELRKYFLQCLKADGYGEVTKEFFVVPSTQYAISRVRQIIKACKKSYKKEETRIDTTEHVRTNRL